MKLIAAADTCCATALKRRFKRIQETHFRAKPGRFMARMEIILNPDKLSINVKLTNTVDTSLTVEKTFRIFPDDNETAESLEVELGEWEAQILYQLNGNRDRWVSVRDYV